MDRIGVSMNRVLHGAGGEETNNVFVGSFVVLIVMVLMLFAFSGDSVEAPLSAHMTKPKAQNTDNLEHPEWHHQVQPRPQNVNLLFIGECYRP